MHLLSNLRYYDKRGQDCWRLHDGYQRLAANDETRSSPIRPLLLTLFTGKHTTKYGHWQGSNLSTYVISLLFPFRKVTWPKDILA